MAGRAATLRIDILADAGKARRELDKTDGRLSRFGKAAGLGAAAAAAGLAVAAVGVAAFGVEAVKSASKLEQAFGGTEAIFSAQADQVKKLAESAADGVGLAASEYSELANVLGSQLKNMGTSADELVPKTDALIRQGADLAATFGGTTADAVAAVSSLLKGERDPIEKYGVSIKQADINARLAADGLTGLTGEAAKQAEQQAILALLTEQTAAAQGAFGRESNTLAGQQQRLGAVWENLKATLGTQLLPVLTAVGGFILQRLVPASQRLSQDLGGRLQPTAARLSSFFTGRVVPAARQVWDWFVNKIAPGIRSAVTPVLAGLRSAFTQVTSSVDRNRAQLTQIGNVLRTVAEFIANRVAPTVGTILGGAFRLLGSIISGTIGTISRIVSTIDNVYNTAKRVIDYLRNNSVADVVGDAFGAAGRLLSSNRGGAAGTPAGLSLATSPAARAGAVVSVAAPQVTVVIDGKYLQDVVDYRVTVNNRAQARQVAYGGIRP